MMFVKPRKFRKLIEGKWDGGLLFEALSLHNIQYTLTKVGDYEDSAILAEVNAMLKGWNTDTLLVMTVKTPNSRILLTCDNITLERLIKITNQVIRMKAFL